MLDQLDKRRMDGRTYVAERRTVASHRYIKRYHFIDLPPLSCKKLEIMLSKHWLYIVLTRDNDDVIICSDCISKCEFLRETVRCQQEKVLPLLVHYHNREDLHNKQAG